MSQQMTAEADLANDYDAIANPGRRLAISLASLLFFVAVCVLLSLALPMRFPSLKSQIQGYDLPPTQIERIASSLQYAAFTASLIWPALILASPVRCRFSAIAVCLAVLAIRCVVLGVITYVRSERFSISILGYVITMQMVQFGVAYLVASIAGQWMRYSIGKYDAYQSRWRWRWADTFAYGIVVVALLKGIGLQVFDGSSVMRLLRAAWTVATYPSLILLVLGPILAMALRGAAARRLIIIYTAIFVPLVVAIAAWIAHVWGGTRQIATADDFSWYAELLSSSMTVWFLMCGMAPFFGAPRQEALAAE